MKSFHILTPLLVTTVLWKPTVSSKSRDYLALSPYKLTYAPDKIDYTGFKPGPPVSNGTDGWPYKNKFIRLFDSYPSHVAPLGCAWYSQRAPKPNDWCEHPLCPYGKREVFRGVTLQRVLNADKTKEAWKSQCPRQHNVRVNATYCCDNDIFRKKFTVGAFTTKPREFRGDCQWIGPSRMCYEDDQRCPANIWRNEVARASQAWRIHKNETDNPITRIFGEHVCEVGDRIFCCKDSAFEMQEQLETHLLTELLYLFPALVRKNNPYAKMKVKLIFAPGATRPPPTTTAANAPNEEEEEGVEEGKEDVETSTVTSDEAVEPSDGLADDDTQDHGDGEGEEEGGEPDQPDNPVNVPAEDNKDENDETKPEAVTDPADTKTDDDTKNINPEISKD